MLNPEWWKRNVGGICFTSFVSVLLYAASAYITSTVSKEMKGYVPASIWSQWAQERGEWRGKVDARLERNEGEIKALREEVQRQYGALDKKQDVLAAQLLGQLEVVTKLLGELKEELRRHTSSAPTTKP